LREHPYTGLAHRPTIAAMVVARRLFSNDYSRHYYAMMKLVLALIAAIAFIASPVTTHAAQTSGGDITVHVAKDGTAFVVSTELTVAANVDEVWAVLTDFDHMAQILSNVDASQIANRHGNKFEVIQKSHASAGPLRISLDSVRQVELSPKQEIRSHLLKGGGLKSSKFTTRIADEGGVIKITVHGKFVASGLSASAITPERVESQTRRQYQELREEILRRKANEPPPPCLVAKDCTQ
jgi:carbon monoxide dehydrogenase subunit G